MEKKKTQEEEVEVIQMHGFRDRVGFAVGKKIQINSYEPVDVSFVYFSDKDSGETLDEAAGRVIGFAQKRLQPILKRLFNEKHRKA